MKFSKLALALLLTFGITGAAWTATVAVSGQEHNRLIYSRVRSSIVGVEANGEFFSGVVVSPDGLIVSDSAAVTERNGPVYVVAENGVRTVATVLARDPCSGLVLLRAATGESAIAFGDSCSIDVGTLAYTAANPFEALRDQQVALSAGHLTAFQTFGNSSERVFETDAAINPGSEGGALLDGEGRLIGVLTSRLDPSRRVGIAVPLHWVLRTFSSYLQTRQLFPQCSRNDSESDDAAVVRVHGISGEAAGVLIDPAGLVLTCASGISLRSQNIVVEQESARYAAHVLASDETLDIALLKIEPPAGKKFDALPLSTGCEICEGKSVVVRSRGACNRGIVSASKRFFGTACQIDAKINAGNYGGPVLDAHSRLIGIVSHFDPSKDYSQPNCGVGFFTPAQKISAYFGSQLLNYPQCCQVSGSDTSAESRYDLTVRWIANAKRCTALISNGSGVVISHDGYLLTCLHVADGRNSWPVRVQDHAYVADVIDRDADADLCLLKIRGAHNLPYAEVSDAGSVQVGDSVLSGGDPFKLAGADGMPAFSVGIVSALHRNQGRCHDVIQTDAAINPGSSGGPQFNRDGKLIGINGQIRYRFSAVANTGVGFGISSAKAAKWMRRTTEMLVAVSR